MFKREAMNLFPQERSGLIERSTIDEQRRTVELSFSSEFPVERPWGTEILGHKKTEIDLSRLAIGSHPLLVDHVARTDHQVGVVEKAWVAKGKGMVRVRFGKGKKGKEIWRRVLDGELSSISVGYRIFEMVLQKQKDGERDTYRITSWTPYEVSVVAIPADPTVGVGREDQSELEVRIIDDEKGNDPVKRNKTKAPVAPNAAPAPAAPAATPAPADTRSIPAAAAATVQIPVTEQEREATLTTVRTEELARIAGLTDLGTRFDVATQAAEAQTAGTSVEDFRSNILDILEAQRVATTSATSEIGLTGSETQSFRFINLINAMGDPFNRRAQEGAAFELEACRAAEGTGTQNGQGMTIPIEVLRVPLLDAQRVASTAGTAGNLVATDLLSGSFVDRLRETNALLMLGAQPLRDLTADTDIPRMTGGITTGWIGEDADAGESDGAWDQIQLRPKTLSARTKITRRLLVQQSLDVEAMLRNDIATGMSLEVSRAGLYGTGTSNQPEGIANTTGINTTTFAGPIPTHAEIIAMESAVAVDNALAGNIAYLMGSALRGGLKSTLKDAGSGQFVWEDGNTVNGSRAEVSNQTVDGDVFFGNWSDLLVAEWTGIDMIVDPFSESIKGRTVITVFQDADIGNRHPVSFCFSNDT